MEKEHSAIKYDGKAKHFATAIPAGEARYVMNRLSGEIKMHKGRSSCGIPATARRWSTTVASDSPHHHHHR
jgi:hypothetical protein